MFEHFEFVDSREDGVAAARPATVRSTVVPERLILGHALSTLSTNVCAYRE